MIELGDVAVGLAMLGAVIFLARSSGKLSAQKKQAEVDREKQTEFNDALAGPVGDTDDRVARGRARRLRWRERHSDRTGPDPE